MSTPNNHEQLRKELEDAKKMQEQRKKAEEEEREENLQTIAAGIVRMAEGNETLKKKTEETNYIPGEITRIRGELSKIRADISDLEQNKIPELTTIIETAQKYLDDKEGVRSIIERAQTQIEANTKKIEALKIRLGELNEYYQELYKYNDEQEKNAKDAFDYAIDACMKQQEQAGQPLPYKKEEIITAVERERIKRYKKAREKYEQEADARTAKLENIYFQEILTELSKLQSEVSTQFDSIESILQGQGQKGQELVQEVEAKKTLIKKLQGKKFILNRKERERKNEWEIEEIKNNLKNIAIKYYELITNISEQVRNFYWLYMKNKKLIKDEQDSSYFMLKDPPFYYTDDIKTIMETKRNKIVERIEQFLQKTRKEGDALDQLVFRNIAYNEK